MSKTNNLVTAAVVAAVTLTGCSRDCSKIADPAARAQCESHTSYHGGGGYYGGGRGVGFWSTFSRGIGGFGHVGGHFGG